MGLRPDLPRSESSARSVDVPEPARASSPPASLQGRSISRRGFFTRAFGLGSGVVLSRHAILPSLSAQVLVTPGPATEAARNAESLGSQFRDRRTRELLADDTVRSHFVAHVQARPPPGLALPFVLSGPSLESWYSNLPPQFPAEERRQVFVLAMRALADGALVGPPRTPSDFGGALLQVPYPGDIVRRVLNPTAAFFSDEQSELMEVPRVIANIDAIIARYLKGQASSTEPQNFANPLSRARTELQALRNLMDNQNWLTAATLLAHDLEFLAPRAGESLAQALAGRLLPDFAAMNAQQRGEQIMRAFAESLQVAENLVNGVAVPGAMESPLQVLRRVTGNAGLSDLSVIRRNLGAEGVFAYQGAVAQNRIFDVQDLISAALIRELVLIGIFVGA